MTVLEAAYRELRDLGHGHAAAIRRVAQLFDVDEGSVSRSLERAERDAGRASRPAKTPRPTNSKVRPPGGWTQPVRDEPTSRRQHKRKPTTSKGTGTSRETPHDRPARSPWASSPSTLSTATGEQNARARRLDIGRVKGECAGPLTTAAPTPGHRLPPATARDRKRTGVHAAYGSGGSGARADAWRSFDHMTAPTAQK
jgi:hypothetical protein